MSDIETAAESDHRLLPPLTGAGDEGEAELVETADDLENLDDDEAPGVGPV